MCPDLLKTAILWPPFVAVFGDHTSQRAHSRPTVEDKDRLREQVLESEAPLVQRISGEVPGTVSDLFEPRHFCPFGHSEDVVADGVFHPAFQGIEIDLLRTLPRSDLVALRLFNLLKGLD